LNQTPKKRDPEVQNKLKKLVEILPEDFLSHMHAVSRTTGFSIPSIHAILIGLKQPNDLEYAAVQALKKLEIEKALGEFFFTKLRCIYEASEKQLLTVEEIIALLNCGNQHAVACFLQCSRELRSKDLSQITYSVSEELAEIVEREVVDQKDYFQQKNKYSDVEWASVVSGFKERAILWTGCYPDNTQVEFESMDVMTSNHPLVMVGLTGETARPLLLENPDDSMRATLAPECLAFLKREHQLPDQLQAKWDQLRQNAQILETQGKDLLAELGLEHKLVSLQYFISNTFRATANNAPNTLATKCATFIQTVQDHFGGFSELDERLGAHSRSHDAFVKYCKNLLDAKQVGPQTIAMVAKLSNFDVVIWEQQPASRVLRAKVTSNLNNKERIHLLLLPSENGTYKYAMLFLFRPVRMHLSSADELVGPGEVDGEVKHNTPLAQEEEVPLDLEEKVPLEQLEEKVPLDLEEEVPLGLEEEVPLDLEEKVPLDLEGKVPLDFEEKAPQALPNIEEAINVNNEAHSQQSEPPIDADPQQREEISPANPDS